MRPIARCEMHDGETCLDSVADIWLTLDDRQQLTAARQGTETLALQNWTSTDAIETLQQRPTVVSADIGMRDALHIRYQTGQKLILSEGNQVLGILGDRELYHALLGKAMG